MTKTPDLEFWDCPHCGKPYDLRKQDHVEEATFRGIIAGPPIPHIRCPSCKQCMGCQAKSNEESA
jgi:hypothetical protein